MLRISRFVTQCKAPRTRPEVYTLVDSMAREQVARELAAHLGPSLSKQAGVVHIRQLRIRIEIRGGTLDRRVLIETWVRAIGRQLFTALAYPHGGGHFEIQRAPSAAHFRAELVRDLLSGAAEGRWAYRSHAAVLRMPRAVGVLAILRENPTEIAETLEALNVLGALEQALSILDDLACEEIFRAIAASGSAAIEAPWQEVLAALTRVIARHSLSRGMPVDSRMQALRMFTLARSSGVRLGPRVWFTALTALALLSENGELWTDSQRTPERICGRTLTPDVAEFLSFLRHGDRGLVGAAHSPYAAQLRAALDAAALRVPEPVISRSEPAPWLDFEGASLLLLTGPLMRLGWAADWRGVAREASLYALACALRGPFNPAVPFVDRDAALFAGIFGEASASGLRGFFIGSAPPAGRAKDWPSSMDSLAAALLAWRTARLPGFRKAARAAIVRQFLTAPGRVRVEEQRVTIALAPRPVYVALRIGSLDDPVERMSPGSWPAPRIPHGGFVVEPYRDSFEHLRHGNSTARPAVAPHGAGEPSSQCAIARAGVSRPGDLRNRDRRHPRKRRLHGRSLAPRSRLAGQPAAHR